MMAQGWWLLIKPEIQHIKFLRQFLQIQETIQPLQPQQRRTIRGQQMMGQEGTLADALCV